MSLKKKGGVSYPRGDIVIFVSSSEIHVNRVQKHGFPPQIGMTGWKYVVLIFALNFGKYWFILKSKGYSNHSEK